jgi:hypothetical protein
VPAGTAAATGQSRSGPVQSVVARPSAEFVARSTLWPALPLLVAAERPGTPRFRPLAAAARGDNVLRPFQGLQKGERELPDIWTEHPEIVRDLLREAGLTCGVEPRILKGRDPDWTCILDGKNIAGDIYIHQADTILGVGMAAVAFALLGVLLGVVIVLLWQAWVISRLKRKLRSS